MKESSATINIRDRIYSGTGRFRTLGSVPLSTNERYYHKESVNRVTLTASMIFCEYDTNKLSQNRVVLMRRIGVEN